MNYGTSAQRVRAPLLTSSSTPGKVGDVPTTTGGTIGLRTIDVQRLRDQFGYNEIKEQEKNVFLQLASHFWGAMPCLIEVAAIVSCIVGDWKDFGFLLLLLLVNGIFAFHEEYTTGNAVKELKESLSNIAKVKRDGEWTTCPARELVPGDIVLLRLGDVVPADCVLRVSL